LEGPSCLLLAGAPDYSVHTGHYTMQRLRIPDWLISISRGTRLSGGWHWTVRCANWPLALADVSTSHWVAGTPDCPALRADCPVFVADAGFIVPRAAPSGGPSTGLSDAHRTVRWLAPDHSVLRRPVQLLLSYSKSLLLLLA
jgi:hypothetical protein